MSTDESKIVEAPVLPVDKDWLVKIINEKCPDSRGVLKDYKCSLIGEGKGFMSVITRAVLEWDPEKSNGIEQLPNGVIFKQPTTMNMSKISEEMAQMITEDMLKTVHNQECSAYKIISVPDGPIPTAKVFHIQTMEKSGDGMLILEDLTDKAKSLSFGEHMSPDQVMALATHFGKLQAYGFNHPEYRDSLKPFDMSEFKSFFDKINEVVKQIGDVFQGFPFTSEAIEEKMERSKKIFDFFKTLEEQNLTPVLALGDCQPNNILWEREHSDHEKPSAKVCAFIDFQITGPNVAPNDMVNAFSLAMTAEGIRTHEAEMLDRYWAALQANLTPAGKSRCSLTIAEVRRLYRISNFLNGLMIVPHLDSFMKGMGLGEDFKNEVRDRFIAFIEDFDKP